MLITIIYIPTEMYLLGTGMLNFGFSMYAMFVRVGKMQTEHNNNLQHPILSATARSNLHQKVCEL